MARVEKGGQKMDTAGLAFPERGGSEALLREVVPGPDHTEAGEAMKPVFGSQWCGQCFALQTVTGQGARGRMWSVSLACGHGYELRRAL